MAKKTVREWVRDCVKSRHHYESCHRCDKKQHVIPRSHAEGVMTWESFKENSFEEGHLLKRITTSFFIEYNSS